MSCEDLTTLKLRLAEAEAAFHKLQLGQQRVSVTFGPSKSVSYTAANISELRRYIADLKDQIAACEGRLRRGIVRFTF